MSEWLRWVVGFGRAATEAAAAAVAPAVAVVVLNSLPAPSPSPRGLKEAEKTWLVAGGGVTLAPTETKYTGGTYSF